MNSRRTLILASGAYTALAAFNVRAQAPKEPRRISWLLANSVEAHRNGISIFTATLKELGRAEGRDYVMDFHSSDGMNERLPALAGELLARNPAVIATSGSAAIGVLKKATNSVPIVFATGGNLVEQGFVESLRRPGGNITGMSLRTELQDKLVELVRETLPASRRIALIVDDGDPVVPRMTDGMQGLAARLGYVKCREAPHEALTGVRVGQPLSREIHLLLGADAVIRAEGNTVRRAIASAQPAPAWSETLACTYARLRGNREISSLDRRCPYGLAARVGKARSRSR